MVMLCIDVGAHVVNGEGAAAVVCGGIMPWRVTSPHYGGAAADGEPRSSGSPAACAPGEGPAGNRLYATGHQT